MKKAAVALVTILSIGLNSCGKRIHKDHYGKYNVTLEHNYQEIGTYQVEVSKHDISSRIYLSFNGGPKHECRVTTKSSFEFDEQPLKMTVNGMTNPFMDGAGYFDGWDEMTLAVREKVSKEEYVFSGSKID